MKPFFQRFRRIAILLPLLYAAGVHAQSASIQVAVNNYYYNCSTGTLNISYRVINNDGFNTPNLNMNYGLTLGGVSGGSKFSSSSMVNDTYIGPYTPGDAVIIWGQGTNNNSAPYSTYWFVPAPAGTAPSSPPVISVSGPTSICSGQSTTLVASGSGTITWSNGAIGSSIIVYDPGDYSATASAGCGASDPSNIITITSATVPAGPIITSSAGNLLCNGATTILSTSPSGGGTIYWNTGQTGNSITVSSTGVYYAREINGCGTGSFGNNLFITTGNSPSAPVITPTGPIALCNGSTATLNVTGGGGGNTRWYRNSGLIGINSGTQIVSQAGSYTATISNSCGASAESTPVVITTGAVPAAPSVSPPGSHLLCNGQTLALTATGSNITWSNGTTGNNLTVSNAGSYYAVDNNSCGNSSPSNSVVVTTGNCPTPSPGTSFFICPGAFKTLDAGAGYDSYVWSTGATTRTISVGPGNYSVSVTKDGCTSTSTTVTVGYYTVNAVLINAPGPTTFCAGGSVNLSASAGSSWAWSNGAVTQSISVSTSGSYAVTVTDPNGCQAVSAPVTVTVRELPTATISGTATVCKNGNSPFITFSANGGVPPYTFSYNINGGGTQTVTTSGSNSITVNVPTATGGVFTYNLLSVRESSSTTCTSTASGSATITVSELPSATITGDAVVCKNATWPAVRFTGSGGNPPYTFSFRINGGGLQTVTPGSGSAVNLLQPTDIPGTYVYELISVKETTGLTCASAASGTVTIVVKDLPSATISGSTTVCRNASSPDVSFTGAGGTAPYTFSYRINGGSVQTVTTGSGNTATIPVPTSTAGSYTYSLVGVTESGSGCSNAATGDATVVVRELPSASIDGNTTICQNSTQPVVVFNGSNGTAPYTFSYRINNGALLSATTIAGNSVSVNVPTNAAGTFTYSLVSVKESGTGACDGAVNGSVSIVINPQPVNAVIAAPNTHLCNGEAGQLTVFNWVSGNTYTWYRNGTVFATSVAQTIAITQAGDYTAIVTTPEGCSSAGVSNTITITTGTVPTPVITGYLKVCEGGKTVLTIDDLFDSYRWVLMPDQRSMGNGRRFSGAAGQYRVRVMREGCYDSTVVAVTTGDTEFPAGHLTISPQSIPYGGKATLVAEVNGAAGYEWDLGDNRKVATLSNTMVQNYFVRDDSVHVKVRAISERNCITEFTAALKVGPPGENVIIDRSWIGNLKDWNLFPNPFHDNLKMSVILKRNEGVRIDLFTLDGRWVMGWVKAGRRGENLFQLEGVERLAANVVYIITAIYNGGKHADRVYRF